MYRSIIHLDMNAFFASVEQQANPELQGKPIAVVGAAHRTVITTASCEARAFGVKTGMAIWGGQRVCPELIIARGDNRKYTHTSSEIIKMMLEYNRKKEQLTKAMDAVNNKLGDFKVTFGSLLNAEEKGSHVSSPAWRPAGPKNVEVT